MSVISMRDMSVHEIKLPQTKPETEWVCGRALQKVSPTYVHGALQIEFGAALRSWAKAGHGRVSSEWRFRIAPPGKPIRPLVPDIGYLSFASVPSDAPAEAVVAPVGAPTVAVEILSPDDRRADVDDKVATYIAAGTLAVIIVDPHREMIVVHDRDGVHVLQRDDTLTHRALPGFTLDVGALFARAKF